MLRIKPTYSRQSKSRSRASLIRGGGRTSSTRTKGKSSGSRSASASFPPTRRIMGPILRHRRDIRSLRERCFRIVHSQHGERPKASTWLSFRQLERCVLINVLPTGRGFGPLPHIDKSAGDRRGRRHRGRHEMGAAFVALTALEIAIRRRGAALAGIELVWVHGKAHGAAGLAPVEARFQKILSSLSASACCFTKPEPGTIMADTLELTILRTHAAVQRCPRVRGGRARRRLSGGWRRTQCVRQRGGTAGEGAGGLARRRAVQTIVARRRFDGSRTPLSRRSRRLPGRRILCGNT